MHNEPLRRDTRFIGAVLTCLGIAGAAALLSFRPIYEPDLWWHLAQGREDAAGRIVRSNVFSATYPDYRQRFTPWLFDAGLYRAWQAAGAAGVQVSQTLWLVLALATMYRACRARAPAWSAWTLLALGFVLLEPRAIPRPHLVSFAGMAACALLIERASARRSPAPLVWSIPVIATWSNLHVECVFGVALIAVFSAAEFLRPSALTRPQAGRCALIAVAAALATTLNPYGWGLAAYLYENISVPQILAIAELRPPYLPDYRAFFVYAVLTMLLLSATWRTTAMWEVMAAGLFLILGMRFLRLTPLLWLATAPMVAARLHALTARGIDRRALLITGTCLAFVCSRIPPRLLVTELEAGARAVSPPEFFSPGAIEFMKRAQLDGPVFNSHNLGGYLAWELYPAVRVFQDSRLQAYPPAHFSGIITASGSQEAWNALVRGVDWAVISVPRPNQMSGHGRFPQSEWSSVYLDDAVEIVVRRGSRFSRLVADAPPPR